jgi:alkanesulfonate monooxygenase SsuD/methylene tetrahydromethanopterin reductase-like flavin-dependent oxidoreductase (luciferase family)
MQWALMTEPHLGMTYDTLLRMARFSEEAGLDAFARSDHYYAARIDRGNATDALATLAGLARETERIELVVLVSPITFRHPAVLAKTAATIAEMSGDRLALGVGTGWMDAEHRKFGLPFPALGERFDRLEETLHYLHHAFGRTPGGYTGRHYTLENDEVYPRPGRIRLIVGGSGERRTPRLAGALADEYNCFLRAEDDLAERIDRVRVAAERAGRDPAAVRFSVMTQAIVGETPGDFAHNLDRVAAVDPFRASAAEIEEHHRQRRYPIGTGPEARERIAELAATGVDRIYLQQFGPYEDDFLAETFAALRGH